jgi:hypothetical protein
VVGDTTLSGVALAAVSAGAVLVVEVPTAVALEAAVASTAAVLAVAATAEVGIVDCAWDLSNLSARTTFRRTARQTRPRNLAGLLISSKLKVKALWLRIEDIAGDRF